MVTLLLTGKQKSRAEAVSRGTGGLCNINLRVGYCRFYHIKRRFNAETQGTQSKKKF